MEADGSLLTDGESRRGATSSVVSGLSMATTAALVARLAAPTNRSRRAAATRRRSSSGGAFPYNP